MTGNPPPKFLAQHSSTTEEQENADAVNRRRAVRNLLAIADNADDLVRLTSALELDEELDELATTPERQQRLALARARLDLVSSWVQD